MTILFNMEPLEATEALPYLGCKFALNSRNWASLYRNTSKAQQRWGVVSKVLTKMGATVWAQAMI